MAATASFTVSKIGMPSTSWPPLPGVTPGDDLGAVGLVAQAVEAALAAGEALDDDLGVLVDEDAHERCPLVRREGDGGAGGVEHGGLELQPVGQVRRAGSPGPPRRGCRRGG